MTAPERTDDTWQAPLLADRRLLEADLLQLLAQRRPRVFSAYPAGYLRWLVADTLFIAAPFALDDVEALRTFLLMRFDIAPGFWRQPEIAGVLRDASLAPMARWEALAQEPFGQAWLDAARFDGAREWRERFWGEAGIPGEGEDTVGPPPP